MWIRNSAKVRIAAAASLCALTACQGSAPRVRTPSNVAGEYVLVERDGKRLPHTMRLSEPGKRCDMTLIRDVLVLRPDGEFEGEFESYVRCEGQPRPDSTDARSYNGTFRLHGAHGDTVVLVERGLESRARQRGVLKGDELRVEFEVLTEPRRTMRFRYVRQDATP
ncbi:hypothetical protein [Longimicrobium sp.]|jgi:hypothetical protein|uniref:hypothetical protein n=1 Tax=Longimicrobium sp. TaxID=2029185 RepID=UPI002ED8429A